ncbi:SPOR domain-containing protein [Solidesulfovibrio sp.]
MLAAVLSAVASPALAMADSAALVLEVCGALTHAPGLAGPWPAASVVRPGQTVLAGDLGLGCRFRLAGGTGTGPVLVTAALERSQADGGTAVDRWFVPVRRGEAAAAVYAFAPGLPRPAGDWTLTLAAPGIEAAVVRFQMPEAAVGAASPVPAPSVVGPVAGPPVPAPASLPAPDSPPSPSRSDNAAAGPAASPPKPPVAVPSPPAKSPAAAPSPSAKAAAPTGYVALQTGLFADADNAAAQAARLRARGLPACVAVSGPPSRRRYRVLAGRFSDRRAASEARAGVTAILGLTPLVYVVEASEAGRLRCR